jgi:hypothetical protein
MALIECPDCTKPVSTAAASCPSCGRPLASLDDLLSPDAIIAFIRTILEGTLQPRRFLVRSESEPQRYAPAKRILLTNGVIAGIVVSIAFWIRPGSVPSVVQKITAAATSIALPWIVVIGFRMSGRVVRGAVTWRQATRLGAFKACSALFFLPLTFIAMTFSLHRGGDAFFGYAPTFILTVVYGALAFRSIGVTRGRSVLGGALVWFFQTLLLLIVVLVLGIVLRMAGTWIPELHNAGSGLHSAVGSGPPRNPPIHPRGVSRDERRGPLDVQRFGVADRRRTSER